MIPLGSRGIFYVPISVEQLRAARGLLGWSQSDLAARAGLSLPTVKRLEGGFGPRVQTKREKNCGWRSKRLGSNSSTKTAED